MLYLLSFISHYHALLALLLRRRYGGQGYAIRVPIILAYTYGHTYVYTNLLRQIRSLAYKYVRTYAKKHTYRYMYVRD